MLWLSVDETLKDGDNNGIEVLKFSRWDVGIFKKGNELGV
jgi:hypothetical protein